MFLEGLDIHSRVMAVLDMLELPAIANRMLALLVARLSQAKAVQSRLQLNGKWIGMPTALQQWQLMNGFLWQTVLWLTVGH